MTILKKRGYKRQRFLVSDLPQAFERFDSDEKVRILQQRVKPGGAGRFFLVKDSETLNGRVPDPAAPIGKKRERGPRTRVGPSFEPRRSRSHALSDYDPPDTVQPAL